LSPALDWPRAHPDSFADPDSIMLRVEERRAPLLGLDPKPSLIELNINEDRRISLGWKC
jgi:hypothetical protein